MGKQRFYITPNSLGSYFGIGFNSPQDQIQVDMGLEVADFSDDAKDRMLLGKVLEDSVLDYFEQSMGIKIHSRNICSVCGTHLEERTREDGEHEVWCPNCKNNDGMFYYDGKIKAVFDGRTEINGIDTIVECKVSNASNYKFTDSIAYLLQCQTYMFITDTKQALLCGLYQGKPIYKIIQRDESIIEDIKIVTDFISDVLIGLDDFSNYPSEILGKYSQEVILPEITELTTQELSDLTRLTTLKETVKDLEKQIKEIENVYKDRYSEGIFDNGEIKLTISERSRDGGYDFDRLSIEHPEIDYNSYKKPKTTYKVMAVKRKKIK